MLLYPTTYESYLDGRYYTILIICYDIDHKRIAMKIRYPYSLYVSGVTKSEVESTLSRISGIHIHDDIVRQRSTRDPMNIIEARRIDCDNEQIRGDVMRALQNKEIAFHEVNNMLTALLKMMEERKVKYYCWMEIEAKLDSNKICKYDYPEYVGDVDTLKESSEIRPPPPMSMFSFDLECNSVDWDVMCDAARDMGNEIKVCCITYVHGDIYREYCICNGPDVAKFWKENLEEGVKVTTTKDELTLISYIFAFIMKIDPDIIVGHNIAGFDIPYIIARYRLLSMTQKKGGGVAIPNISRIKDAVIKPYTIEWNNSAVSMSGKLLNVPGRIWVDTLILSSRGFLGNMENNKLDTLAKVWLGMAKNDVGHKDMFAWFALWDRTMKDGPSEELDEAIDNQYEIGMSKYNKVLPPIPTRITVDHINDLIAMINVMNQRGNRTDMISKKEGSNHNLSVIYDYTRWVCQLFIDKWNVGRVETREEKIEVLWWIVCRYCVHDTRIPYRVLALQDIITVLMEQSNIFCVPINDILCRGQMHAVQSSQYKYAKAMGFLVDLVDKGDPAGITQVGGGYVGKGKAGLKIKDHNSVVIVLDFASLYPTIIIAMNICYTTWVPYDKRGTTVTADMCNIIYVDDLIDKDTGEKIPRREHWFLKKEILPGIVPSMLDEQRLSRKLIKKKIPGASADMKGTYSAQEKAIKVGMNSAYGAFGTEHSYICNKGCADATTGYGRSSIHICNVKIEEKGIEVVYNDTDSCMCLITGIREKFLSPEEIGSPEESSLLVKRIDDFGFKLAEEISTYFPNPMSLECENVFLSFFLKGPKMYTAIRSDKKSINLSDYGMSYIQANNLLYVKGLASARRDKYSFYKIIYNKILELILTKHDPSDIMVILEKYIMIIWKVGISYKDPKKLEELFSYNIGISYKSLAGSMSSMGKWIPRYENANKRKPLKGERFKLLVCDGDNKNKHTKSADKLYTLPWMEREGKKLDIIHYLMCFESKGGVIELLNIAYGDEIPLKCMSQYYIPQLVTYRHL